MNRLRLAVAAVLSGVLLAADHPSVPWPFGVAPTADAVDALVEDALRIGRRERFGELNATLDVIEAGEALRLPQAEIDRGEFDLEQLFNIGDEVFASFVADIDGFGGLLQGPRLLRVHRGRTGGLDTFACDGCHSVGGLDGAGTFAQNALLLGDGDRASSAVVRNPPTLLGLGLVQALAVEMSAELARQRDTALARARATGEPARAELSAKGVAFGALTAHPDGTVDRSGVAGVSADLVVRPFGWKGDQHLLRRFVEEAARQHFGLQSWPLEKGNFEATDTEAVGEASWDPDQDGRTRELEEGSVTATAAYLALLETPVIVPPASPDLLRAWGAGSRRFDALGCAGCHLRTLTLLDRVWEEYPDTTGGPPVTFNLLVDGEQPRGLDQVNLFSDLKRHDMGPALADPRDHPDGIPAAEFLTRPLWGLAESAPYLHDGRAATIPEAILAHGGEASASRDAFAALTPAEQADLHVFLLSLTRQPKVRLSR